MRKERKGNVRGMQNDLISRKEAVEIVESIFLEPIGKNQVLYGLLELPSRQPMWIENSKGERIALDKVGADKAVKILEILGE